MNRNNILETANQLTSGDRDASYGTPTVNMQCIAELWAVYKKYAGDKHPANHDAAMFQTFVKQARIATGGIPKMDNYIDGSCYFAIAGECMAVHLDNVELARSMAAGQDKHPNITVG